MSNSAQSLKRLTFSLTLAVAAALVLTALLSNTRAQTVASGASHAPGIRDEIPLSVAPVGSPGLVRAERVSAQALASDPPQDPPTCLADVAIVLDVGGSMQEDTRCYGCFEVGAGEYPSGTFYPLPVMYADPPTNTLLYHCAASEPLLYAGRYYVSIEAEHYSRYDTAADYHRNWTEYPKTWWAMQRQPDRSASGPDDRGAFMMVGPNSDGANSYPTIDDIVNPDGTDPDYWTTPRLEYDFTVPVSDTYYVWFRAQGGPSLDWLDWANNRESRRQVYVGLNGVPDQTVRTCFWGPYNDGASGNVYDNADPPTGNCTTDSEGWSWSRVPVPYSLNAGQAYELDVWAAGQGFRLDKIVITNETHDGLDRDGWPLDWDLFNAADGGPVETHGRTDWACMVVDDPRFNPINPYSGQRDDLYDDLQPIRATQEAFKGMLQGSGGLSPTLDQVGYVVYSDTARIEHELYCLVDPGACADWGPVVEAIEAATTGGLHTGIAEGMWDGLRALLPGPEPDWDPPDGFPSREPGREHLGRADASPMMILMTDGIPDSYPNLPPGYGRCYDQDLWPDIGIDSIDRARDCVIWFAQLAQDHGVTIYTIGLGALADNELLDHVAEVTGGAYYFAPSAEELDAVVDHISERVHYVCWPWETNLINYATPDYHTAVGDRINYTLQASFRDVDTILANEGGPFLYVVSHFPSGTDLYAADEPFAFYGDHISWSLSLTETLAHWGRRHLTLELSGTQDAALVNVAQLVGARTGTVYATGTVTTTYVPALSYDLDKRIESLSPIVAGDRVTYTLWLSTNGPHFPAVITDRLPSSAVFVTATLPFSPAQPVAGQPLIWPLTRTHFNLAGLVSRTLVLQVPQFQHWGPLTNTAQAGDDLGYHVVEDSAVVTVHATPTVALAKRSDPAQTVQLGERITYTLDLTVGGWITSAFWLTDLMPAETVFITATPGFTPTTPVDGGTIAWLIPDGVYSPTETLSRTIVLSVTGAPGRLTNVAVAAPPALLPITATASVWAVTATQPNPCLWDVAIALNRSASMQEDTLCYGCYTVDASGYPTGTVYPLPIVYADPPTNTLPLQCASSEPLSYTGHYYLSIEAELYSRYDTAADYHRDWTEYPKTWWAMQRDPNESASGLDDRGAFMMVGPNSAAVNSYPTIDDIVNPDGTDPDSYWTTPRLEYDFTVPDSDTYYVWFRAQGGPSFDWLHWANNRESRRQVYIGLNGVPSQTVRTCLWGPYNDGASSNVTDNWDPPLGNCSTDSSEGWSWSRAPNPLSLNAGETYELDVWAAGQGFRLDKIVITNDPDTELDRDAKPLDWDSPGVNDRGPTETHGRTDWACMMVEDPRFNPINPYTDERDDLYDDYQPMRAAKESAKNLVRKLNPELDQIGYLVYTDDAQVENELYCLREGMCLPGEDFGYILNSIEATHASGNDNIADALWSGLLTLLEGKEPALDPDGQGLPSKEPGREHYGRSDATRSLILMADGSADRYPTLPSEYGNCYSDDLWPDIGIQDIDRARECVVWFALHARAQGVVVHTVGLGPQADSELLDYIADLTGGWYYFAPSSDELDAIVDDWVADCPFSLQLAKRTTPSPIVSVGDLLTYTVETTVSGRTQPTLWLLDYMPTQTNFITATPDFTFAPPFPDAALGWQLQGKSLGQPFVFSHTVVVSVAGPVGPLTNTVAITQLYGAVSATANATIIIVEPSLYLPIVLKQ